MYVGDSSNSPVEQMSVKKYSQTSNPNLLINTNFFNLVNQRNQTRYDNTTNVIENSVDRWQVLGGTFNVGDGEKYFTTISFYPMRVVPTITIASAHYWGGFSGLTCSIPQTDGVYNDRTLQLAVNATASNPGGAFTAVIVLEAEL